MQRKYLARAREWALGETASGGEQIAVHFDIITPDADLPAITWYGYFTDKTFQRTIESLRICGWTGCDLTDLSGLGLNEVELVIEDEEYDGRIRPKVRWVNKPGGVAIKAPLAGDRAKAFAAQMKERIKALEAGTQKPAPKAQPKPAAKRPVPFDDAPPPISDDDLAF